MTLAYHPSPCEHPTGVRKILAFTPVVESLLKYWGTRTQSPSQPLLVVFTQRFSPTKFIEHAENINTNRLNIFFYCCDLQTSIKIQRHFVLHQTSKGKVYSAVWADFREDCVYEGGLKELVHVPADLET